jgi:hypothetical protein
MNSVPRGAVFEVRMIVYDSACGTEYESCSARSSSSLARGLPHTSSAILALHLCMLLCVVCLCLCVRVYIQCC